MTEKTIIDNKEHTESRAYEDYIRSMGEQRDGLNDNHCWCSRS